MMATFLAAVLASSLFDEKIANGRRTFRGIVLSSLIFLTMIISVFFYPQIVLSLDTVNFTYVNGGVNDSLINLLSNAYVKQQVFLGKSDEDFSRTLRYVSNDSRDGRVVFYSNRSQTVDMFYYYAMLPASGKSTSQGVAPEGEGDLKWSIYTQRIIWNADETLLRLSGTRWVISNYPIALEGNPNYKLFGQYRVYELGDVKMINGCEGSVYSGVGEIRIALDQGCRSFTVAESYHPRWRAFDQGDNEVKIERTEYGFMRLSSTSDMREVRLVYSDTKADILGRLISAVCLALFAALFLKGFNFSKRSFALTSKEMGNLASQTNHL